MTLQIVEREILGPMQRLYLPPRSMTESQITDALREYAASLDRFDEPDLKAAWVEIRDNHTARSWPVPAAIILAARKARKERLPAKRGGKTDEPTQEELWDRWKAIRVSEMGREALRRNVAWSLKCAVLHDKKEAHEINLTELVIGKARAEKRADLIDAGKPVEWKGRILELPTDSANAAMRLWRGIMVKEEETQQEIRNAA